MQQHAAIGWYQPSKQKVLQLCISQYMDSYPFQKPYLLVFFFFFEKFNLCINLFQYWHVFQAVVALL